MMCKQKVNVLYNHILQYMRLSFPYPPILRTGIKWQHFVTFIPLWLATGALITIHYSWQWGSYGAYACALLALYTLKRSHTGLCQSLIVLGICWFAASYTHEYIAHQPLPLGKPYRFIALQGVVKDIQITENRYRIVIQDIAGETLSEEDKGKTVRLTMRSQQSMPKAGNTVSFKATIFPPSRPSLPYSYDYALYFFSRGISGIGYITSTVQISENAQTHKPWLTNPFSDFRHKLHTYLLQALPQPEAGIIIALITGEQTSITEQAREAMTVSGLSHILSISGLHMAIFCGGVFFSIRLALAAIPILALHYPIKQWAALAGFISGAAYLALADAPISAIRAYAMIALMFLAILCKREADALRSLVLAACAMLLVNPLLVADISFQLSFIAVLALILAFRQLRPLHSRLRETYRSWVGVGLLYISESGLSSLIAGLATAPLMMYHFNQFSSYTLLANMLALPLLSFVIAPALVLALILAPLGLHSIPLMLASEGISAMLAIAHFVSAIEGAKLATPPLAGIAVIAMLLLLFLTILSPRMWQRMLAFIGAFLPLLSWLWMTSPDIVMAEDGSAVAVRQTEDNWLLLRGTTRNFHAESWQQVLGGNWQSYKDAAKAGDTFGWICEKTGCDGMVKGKHLRLRLDYKDPSPLCLEHTDILLSSFYSNRWQCASPHALRVDRDALEKQGGHALWITEDIPILWHSCEQRHHARWLRCHK